MNYILKNSLMILIASLFFIGCGYKQTNTQISEVGYIKFEKNSMNRYGVVINDKYTLDLEPCIFNEETKECTDETKNTLYEIKSGNNNLKIYDKNKILILEKNYYIGSSNTIEVKLK